MSHRKSARRSTSRSWAQAFRFMIMYLVMIACVVFMVREKEIVIDIVLRGRAWLARQLEEPEPPAMDPTPETVERLEEISVRMAPLLEPALEEKGLKLGLPIYLRAFKESSELEVWMQKPSGEFQLFKTYEICRWSGELGPKLKEGDQQTPEGFYFVTASRMNPNSRYHLAFNIGYPNRFDRYHGRTGSLIMVHGACVSIGCLAMTDEKIEEIYSMADAALDGGQNFFRVHIFPFRMTDERMDKAVESDSPWLDFWINLKEGYDYFEIVKRPPNTELEGGKYIFE